MKAKANINIRDVFGQNALENHLVANRFVNRQLAMLLFAAGEMVRGRSIYKYNTCGKVSATLLVPDFLLQDHLQFCLVHLCRKVIRQRLIDVSPNEHLFSRVPQIGLPSVLTNYLLHNMSIDSESFDYNPRNPYCVSALPPPVTPIYVTTPVVDCDIRECENDSDDDCYEVEGEEPESEIEEPEEEELDQSTVTSKEGSEYDKQEEYEPAKEETEWEEDEILEAEETVNKLEQENVCEKDETENFCDARKPQQYENRKDVFTKEEDAEHVAVYQGTVENNGMKKDCSPRKDENHEKHQEEQLDMINMSFEKGKEEQLNHIQNQNVNEMEKEVDDFTSGDDITCGDKLEEKQDLQTEEVDRSKVVEANVDYWNKDREDTKFIEEEKDQHREDDRNEKEAEIGTFSDNKEQERIKLEQNKKERVESVDSSEEKDDASSDVLAGDAGMCSIL